MGLIGGCFSVEIMSDEAVGANFMDIPMVARVEVQKVNGGDAVEVDHETFEDTQKKELLRCRICGNIVSSTDQKIRMNGHHLHTFFNPQGIVFELGCFREARGCINHGELTSEFTWFSGFLWVFSSCRRCGEHLGWFYRAEDGEDFYGLIVSKLREERG